MIFYDRIEAGQKMIEKLLAYKDDPMTVVVGLPRGGVVTAFEVAQGLHLPLDIVVPRKIGAPMNPELAIGAITEDGQGILCYEVIEACGISPEYIAKAIEREKEEAQRRLKLYRGDFLPIDLEGKNLLLVDDGIATAFTMRAAIASVQTKNPSKIVVVAPVIARDSYERLSREADEIIVFAAPSFFMAVGQFYKNFPQVSDEEVVSLIIKAHKVLPNALPISSQKY